MSRRSLVVVALAAAVLLLLVPAAFANPAAPALTAAACPASDPAGCTRPPPKHAWPRHPGWAAAPRRPGPERQHAGRSGGCRQGEQAVLVGHPRPGALRD